MTRTAAAPTMPERNWTVRTSSISGDISENSRLFGRTMSWTREVGDNKNRCTPPKAG